MSLCRLFKVLFSFLSLILLSQTTTVSSETKPGQVRLNNNFILKSSVSKGIENLYNLDFDDAKSQFSKAIAADSESPVGYFYTAMIYWERILNNPNDKEAFKLFDEWTSKTIEICQKKIEKNGKDDETLLYLGGSYGFKARKDLTKKSWWPAFWNAKKGRNLLKEAFDMNPQNFDLYLGLGMYDYFLDKMPKIVKFFSFLLSFSGKKELGIEKLHKCATDGKYAKTEAKFVLMSIYTYLEKEYLKALPIALDLKNSYPENPRFYYTTAIILSGMKKWDEALRLADEISSKAEKEEKNFTLNWLPRTNYLRGEIFRGKKDYDEAIKFYNLAINSELSNETWVLPWSHLKIGMIYDTLGQREKARVKYQGVLKLEDVSEENTYVHELAGKYLEKSYSKNETGISD